MEQDQRKLPIHRETPLPTEMSETVIGNYCINCSRYVWTETHEQNCNESSENEAEA